jgi:hypothetical protein
MSNSLSKTADEAAKWFFEDYLPTWAAAGAAKVSEGEDSILRYWDDPLYTDHLGQNQWATNAKGVLDFLILNHGPLKAQGYTHTVVPDRKVTAYSENSAGIEVIWSRRRADESEIQRLAVHFGTAKTPAGWRVITIDASIITEDKLDAVWETAA